MENDSLPSVEEKPPKLRWFQYRLRSLFVLTTLVAIACSWLTVTMQEQRKQKAAAEVIEKAGGMVISERTWLGKLLRDDSLVRVTYVEFSGQSITDAHLVNLQPLSQLRVLSLRNTKVTDAGLVHLQCLSQLQYLWIRNADITDAGLVHLYGLDQLDVLLLTGTKVTDRGLWKLQQALPNCATQPRR
jgi:hypothetical protein